VLGLKMNGALPPFTAALHFGMKNLIYDSVQPSKWPRGNKLKSDYCFNFQCFLRLFADSYEINNIYLIFCKHKRLSENSGLCMKPVFNQHFNKSASVPQDNGSKHFDYSWQISFAFNFVKCFVITLHNTWSVWHFICLQWLCVLPLTAKVCLLL
jgi:hypothetical protein